MRCQPSNQPVVYNWLKNKQTCLLCDEPADTVHPLCSSCEAELPWLGGHCQVCALPLPSTGLTCGACLKRPPSFQRVEAPWRYAFPIDTAINRFKHQAKWPLGRLLGGLLSHHLQHAFAEGLARPDLLLPVPLAGPRQRQRGFNQAGLLSQWLSASLHLPQQPHWLERTSDTPAQQQLTAAARQRNLRRAFALTNASRVEGLHLALIDDVLTTGATAESLARLLLRGGAARVDVYCLARTAKPGDD
ncbi:ComF family protein [Pseudomonas sp. UBA2684]|uniref:ComF family protein n=1 Tax=Pseudomonas sp. UBA2684 TaxID=1947311 RepID=UPI000E808E4F|nr:ComF family protein [Pseudomonas sp. UBA2684]HBX55056.1 amidophosphoribosyltransferase [Pseudomonas sp.]|tara:strand:+ start:9215 stop:9952 length:738 start_codon:yes stop_codon:yes gene_type:complete